MPSRWFCLLLALLPGLCLPWGMLHAAEIYRGIDEQGNVVFSDRPLGNGEPIEPMAPSVVPLGEAVSHAEAKRPTNTDPTPFTAYATFDIRAPHDEQTLPTGHAGNLRVELDIDPKLRDGDQVRLLLDGEHFQPEGAPPIELTNLERGEHTLQAELLDADGKVRHRSEAVTFYVQRASVNLPQNPNNPAH